MEGPTRPDLRETIHYVGGVEDRSHHTPSNLSGDDASRQALVYADLLRTLAAVGDTVDRLNGQVRALLTRVGPNWCRKRARENPIDGTPEVTTDLRLLSTAEP